MKKIDLTWGESVAVREAFVETSCFSDMIPFEVTYKDMLKMGYTSHDGDPELIELTKKVIKRQVGHAPKHILITNGATGGVTIALRAYKQLNFNTVFTRSAPYFTVYPDMIKAAGFKRHVTEADTVKKDDLALMLLDSPTNPEGFVLGPSITSPGGLPIIWDAVYHSRVYGKILTTLPYDVMVGSYSKFTGINGIRIGWIATDNYFLYEMMRNLVTAEYCGLSSLSTEVLKSSMVDMDWDKFEQKANRYLDYNREEWAKLSKYFEGKEPPSIGMFYYGMMDKACKKLMDKAGVSWMCSSKLGVSNDDFGRFNIGQNNRIVKQAVAAVLKADRRK